MNYYRTGCLEGQEAQHSRKYVDVPYHLLWWAVENQDNDEYSSTISKPPTISLIHSHVHCWHIE
uniref:Uncharacterized protein n=1 Tax=Physcomitrium patens TaxID=3218 RepID=A0A7I3ZQZ5_PHYPA